MAKFAGNLEGLKFGKLTVASLSFRDAKSNTYWRCVCECGIETIVVRYRLVGGSTLSCGCFRRVVAKERGLRLRTTPRDDHGKVVPEYHVWENMVQRCTNPSHPNWRHYGGRGIIVCDRWLDFSLFYSDMGPRPTSKHTIDRIDNNRGYSRGNCRWITQAGQVRNSRHNRLLTLNGVTKCLTEWSEEFGIRLTTIRQRLKLGWPVDRALTQPVSCQRRAGGRSSEGPV